MTIPEAGDYEFYIVADGGARLLLNGATSFENWQDVENLPADINRDGSVDFPDLVTVAQHYGSNTGLNTRDDGDISGDGGYTDGNVGFADLVLIAQTYGQKQSPQTFPVSADRIPATYTENQSIPFCPAPLKCRQFEV
jgi:hypothetical protein